MARYSQARADRDAELTQFLIREVFQPEQVEAVMFHSDGRLWRVEVGLAPRSPTRSASGSPSASITPCGSLRRFSM
jgi:hypothetical protein